MSGKTYWSRSRIFQPPYGGRQVPTALFRLDPFIRPNKSSNMKLPPCFLLSIALLLVAGCQNPGIVQTGPNVYQLSREDHGGIFGNKNALKSGVIADANRFAESQGKVAIPVSAREHPIGILADWASFEYVFKLVDPNSKEAKTPMTLVRVDATPNSDFRNMGGSDLHYVGKPLNGGEEAKSRDDSDEASRGVSERMQELKKLLDAGLISQDEYDAKKRVLLDRL